ncbi:Crp/Fnr family transcriptional regulator [Listeria monocytogenes]|nr:Crp/Fnr family transcriptional regulator [Listeria monocytogenes]MCV12368.1 Crp/Fnr family transcriptional regulator [Listeria monocytogenes]
MNHYFFKRIPTLEENWSSMESLFIKKEIPAKTLLLSEGDIANYIYFIDKGALRLWNNDDGRDITVQFFFENQIVASFESWYQKMPSIFSIESIEDTTVMALSSDAYCKLIEQFSEINTYLTQLISERFVIYTNYFLSRIKDTPEKRYQYLVNHEPELVARVPQHYIASYLGITPVSLSRIRNRIKLT